MAAFKRQLELDQPLREAKHPLPDPNLILAPDDLGPSQNDPIQSTIPELAQLYSKAELHFEGCIRKRFGKGAVREFVGRLAFGMLEASLGDFVRLVNMEMGTYFRSRDVAMLFRRLARTDGNTANVRVLA